MTAYEGAFSDAEVESWLHRMRTSYAVNGFGLWAVMLRGSDELIGQCGITWQHIAGERVREMGYLFHRSYWHRDTNLHSMNVALHLVTMRAQHNPLSEQNSEHVNLWIR